MSSRSSPNYDFSRELAKGRVAYEEKRYEEALQICKQALKVSEQDSGKIFIVLDLKCSILIKSEKFDLALESAKLMIRKNQRSARGYYRAASIHKLRGDLTLALKYIEHGKTRADRSDLSYQHLLTQWELIRAARLADTINQKPTDPMTALPLEILQMVLAYLNYSHIVNMLRVSRIWKQILCKLEPLVTTMDFRGSQKQINVVMYRAADQRLVFPKFLAIHNFSPPAAELITTRSRHSRRYALLEKLSIDSPKVFLPCEGYGRLRSIDTGLGSEISLERVFQILSSCQSLEEAVFKRIKSGSAGQPNKNESLHMLELGNAFDLSSFSIPPECFVHYPNLSHLTVNGAAHSQRSSWNLNHNQCLRKLDTYASVIRSIGLPSSLVQWFWDGTEVGQFRYSADDVYEALPNLHAICLSGPNTMDVLRHLHRCQVQPGQLRRVGLHNRQSTALLDSGDPCLCILTGTVELSFESESLQDNDFSAFVRRFPALEVLQLAAPRISGAFVADLLRQLGPQMRKLVLKDCRNVSPDTIDWVRKRGTDMEVHLGRVEVRGGRRLREGWF